MAIHFRLEGNMINIGSDEAKIQLGIVDEGKAIYVNAWV